MTDERLLIMVGYIRRSDEQGVKVRNDHMIIDARRHYYY